MRLPRFLQKLTRRNSNQQNPRKQPRSKRARLSLEVLEDRVVPAAVVYVGEVADFTITVNQGAMGLDAGDEVTWNPGGAQHPQGEQTGLTFGTNAFTSIQDAVTAVDADGTVNVAAGTYSEFVTITKSLELIGAQAGVDARTDRTPAGADESTIDGSGLDGVIRVFASSATVKIDGFTLQADEEISVSNGGFGAAITTVGSSSLTGLEIVNNVVQNSSIGIAPQGEDALIQYNLIQDITIAGPAAGTGIYTDFGLTDATIDNNKFVDLNNAAININSTAGTGNIISNNEIVSSAGSGIYLHRQSGSQVTGNTIDNTLGAGGGITLGGDQSDITISNNEVLGVGAGQSALRLRDDLGGPNSDLTITGNKFNAGTGPYGVRPGEGSHTGTLTLTGNEISGATAAIRNDDASLDIDASANYWGTSDASAVSALITGDGAANVDFTPLLDNGDDDLEVIGFQTIHTSLTVHALGAQVGVTGRISEAIDLVDADGTINILTGAYTEDVDASGKSVILAPGSSPGQVTIVGNLTLDGDNTLAIEITGAAGSEYDRFIVTGDVTLGGAILDLSLDFDPLPNAVFTIITVVGTLDGEFDSLPEGNVTPDNLRISYLSDVTLTSLNPLTGKVLNFLDFDGDSITIKLSGPGVLTVFGVGGASIPQVVANDTTSASTLTISVKKAASGNGQVDVEEIIVDGNLKKLNAAKANLVGTGLNVTGFLGNLTVNDILNGADIDAAGLPTQKTAIKANTIGDGTDISLTSAISSFTVNNVGDSSITAAALDKLTVNGAFNADLETDNLKTAKITGGIADAVWQVGSINSLTVKGKAENWDVEAATLKKAVLGEAENIEIRVDDGVIKSFTATTFIDSLLSIGLTIEDPMTDADVGDFASNGSINKFTIKGIANSPPAFNNSVVAAHTLGTVTLESVGSDGDDDVELYGLLAREQIKRVKIVNPLPSVVHTNLTAVAVTELVDGNEDLVAKVLGTP